MRTYSRFALGALLTAVLSSGCFAASSFTILTPAAGTTSMFITDVSGDGHFVLGATLGDFFNATQWAADNSARVNLGTLPGRTDATGAGLKIFLEEKNEAGLLDEARLRWC